MVAGKGLAVRQCCAHPRHRRRLTLIPTARRYGAHNIKDDRHHGDEEEELQDAACGGRGWRRERRGNEERREQGARRVERLPPLSIQQNGT